MRAGTLMLAALFFASLTAAAEDAAQPVDLVGRNGKFTVKNKRGKVQTVNARELQLKKELIPSAPAPAEKAEDAEPQPETKSDTNPVEPDTNTPAEETPEQKAARATDVEELRQMRNQGGAYFYTEDDQPVSFEEIDRRIATGEVEGLKVVGLHLQEWKPRTKAKKQDDPKTIKKEGAPANPPPEPAKKEY